MIAIEPATAFMMADESEVVATLALSFTRALSGHQLRRLARHLDRGIMVCCGSLADWFVHPFAEAAAPEVLANELKIDFDAFEDETLEIPETWCATFKALCTKSGPFFEGRFLADVREKELSRGVNLWPYTDAIRVADQPKIILAVEEACRTRRLKI